jgi:hypothetical protein
MPNTTNFNWPTPADTDLVKDGAAAIRNFGNGVDTSLIDLKGGTTGQILSKASNTDLDYTWINNDQGDITEVTVSSPLTGGGSSGSVNVAIQDGTTAQKGAVQLEDSTSSTSTTKAATPNSVKSSYDLANAAIPKSLIDAEGDLIVGDAADAVQRLAIGSNGNVLTVDTSVDGKIKWSAPAAAKVLQVLNVMKTDSFTSTSTSFTDVTGLSLSITPSSATSKILIFVTLTMQGLAGTNAGLSRFLRDSTVIIESDAASSRDRSMSMQEGNNASTVATSATYLDSPATTSALTYKVQVRNNIAAQTVYVNRTQLDSDNAAWGRAVSSITLMEIGA